MPRYRAVSAADRHNRSRDRRGAFGGTPLPAERTGTRQRLVSKHFANRVAGNLQHRARKCVNITRRHQHTGIYITSGSEDVLHVITGVPHGYPREELAGARRSTKIAGRIRFRAGVLPSLDVSADGQKFLFIRAEPNTRPTRIDVMLNWLTELEKRVPK